MLSGAVYAEQVSMLLAVYLNRTWREFVSDGVFANMKLLKHLKQFIINTFKKDF